MKIAILDRKALGMDLDLSIFDALGETVIYDNTVEENAVEHIKDADCIIVNKAKLSEKILSQTPNLKLIAEAATGVDNIDLNYCREHHIAVANVPAYSTASVAQVTISIACMLVTYIGIYNEFCRSDAYTNLGMPNRLEPAFNEFEGQTWGIIGYGNIGKKVAEIAKAFGCKVIVNSRTEKEGVENVSLDELLERSDIISIHCPLTEQTKGMINAEAYDKMKRTPLVINVARGAVLDEEATVEAVKIGKVKGFGCDVYGIEPMPIDHPYQKIKYCPNVCLTPHMAWGSVQARQRLIKEIFENIKAFNSNEERNRVENR